MLQVKRDIMSLTDEGTDGQVSGKVEQENRRERSSAGDARLEAA